MNKHQQIEITVYSNTHGYKNERQKDARWLEAMIPVIMKAQIMITDELFLAPLAQAVSICLN